MTVVTAAIGSPLAPDLAGGVDDEAQLGLFLFDRQRVAVDSGGKPALRAKAELVERYVFCGFINAPLQLVLAFEPRALTGDEPQHHPFVAPGHKAQRLEPAGAGIVIFEKETVD